MSRKQNKTMLYLGTTLILCMTGVAFLEAPESETEKKWSPAFNDFPVQNIERIQFQSKNESFLLSKSSGRWMIIDPIRFPADEARIDSILKLYQDLECSDALKSSKAEYGLQSPTYQLVAIESSKNGGEKKHELIVGDESPVSNSNYVLCNDQQPRLSRTKLSTRLRGGLDSFRMSDLTNFKSSQIDSILFPNGLEASKTESGWQQTAPFSVQLDDAKISFWLNQLQTVHLLDFSPNGERAEDSLILKSKDNQNEIQWNESGWVGSTIQQDGGTVEDKHLQLFRRPIHDFYSARLYSTDKKLRSLSIQLGEKTHTSTLEDDWTDGGKLHSIVSTLQVKRVNQENRPTDGVLGLFFEDDSSMSFPFTELEGGTHTLLKSNSEGVDLKVQGTPFKDIFETTD